MILRLPDILTVLIITAVLLATCLVSHDRGLETSSVYDKIAGLEAQIENMTPLPRINVARASIYPLSGEVILEKIE
jgi:hypothetical protein